MKREISFSFIQTFLLQKFNIEKSQEIILDSFENCGFETSEINDINFKFNDLNMNYLFENYYIAFKLIFNIYTNIDIKCFEKITFNLRKIEQLIGFKINLNKCLLFKKHLNFCNLSIENIVNDKIILNIPNNWVNFFNSEIKVVRELLRSGFSKYLIKATSVYNNSYLKTSFKQDLIIKKVNLLRNIFINNNALETYNDVFLKKELSHNKCISIQNSMSGKQFLRNSILQSFSENYLSNFNSFKDVFTAFECGSIFLEDKKDYYGFFYISKNTKDFQKHFTSLINFLIFNKIDILEINFQITNSNDLIEQNFEILYKNSLIGYAGLYSFDYLRNQNLMGPFIFIEINISKLFNFYENGKKQKLILSETKDINFNIDHKKSDNIFTVFNKCIKFLKKEKKHFIHIESIAMDKYFNNLTFRILKYENK